MSSPPFKVKAVFEYSSPHDDDLHFPVGQIITVTEEEDEDWYVGEYVDASGVQQEGIFPRNFVEKYEPTAPPRPTRTNRPKKESEVAPAPAPTPAPAPVPAPAPAPIVEPVKEREPEPEPEEVVEPPAAREPPPPAPKVEAYSPPPVARAAEVSPLQAVTKSVQPPRQSGPPPVSEKPSGGSFRDRIAAFNKAAPPPAPFKPGGLGSGSGSNNFIRKPFVAPPPSKNSYVPPPREPVQPQKIYRRDEDPEIAAKELENQEQAEKAGLAISGDGGNGDQPKPTSLKERIALLQKQQMEQAARHADAAAKKEKPKRPVKKRTESHETFEEGEAVALERQNTADTIGNRSMEAVKEESTIPRRRKSTKGSSSGAPGINPRKSFGDGNEADMSGAGDTTEGQEEISTGRDDSDERPQNRAPPPPVHAPLAHAPVPTREPETNDEEGTTEQGEHQGDDTEGEEEDDIDPEVRRKEELRARMAKMSGGMGMGMMFGAPMPSAPPKKIKKQSTGSSERREYGNDEANSPSTSAPPMPMVSMPGLSRVRSPEEVDRHIGHEDEAPLVSSIRPSNQVPDVEDVIPDRAPPPSVPTQSTNAAPPILGGRPAPPPLPTESHPLPPPTSSTPMSPSAGSESDDELSERTNTLTLATPIVEPSKPPPRNEGPASPTSPASRRASYFPSDAMSPISPTSNKRLSRLPPPIPGTPLASQPQIRAPPPPPPAEAVIRTSTGDHRALSTPKKVTRGESDEEITEYEGDYDTDIASTVPHKDALKAHGKDSSVDDSISARSPVVAPPSLPPPLPTVPRSGPPPLPSQPPPLARQSSDMPRAAPPPPPPTKMPAPWEGDDDEYDPYRYSAPRPNMASGGGQLPSRTEKPEEDIYSASPPKESYLPPPQNRAIPPPPPREAPQSERRQNRQSADAHRPTGPARRSVELSRMSMDSGFVANDVDLAISTSWWIKSRGTPSVYKHRKDVLFEFEEHPSTSRSGKPLITKELFVLFQDYSQTVITVQYDPKDPKDAKLEQRHEQPPSRLRQDQLEQAHEQFGRPLYDAVTGKKDTVVGDGTPQGLIQELLKPFSNALLPVGTRAYGAVVYANLANASTTQNDEIRPGDIITLRNTKFQGKHGPMHGKYSMDVGKPDHVGIVAEWDGTKKKVRAWEQGRESRKTKIESFKLDDLRSGEVKIWRIMPRSWVGWHGQN